MCVCGGGLEVNKESAKGWRRHKERFYFLMSVLFTAVKSPFQQILQESSVVNGSPLATAPESSCLTPTTRFSTAPEEWRGLDVKYGQTLAGVAGPGQSMVIITSVGHLIDLVPHSC